VHTARRGAAAVLAGLALVLALQPEPERAADATPARVAVVVAGADLAAGAVLSAADLSLVRLPPGLAPAGTSGEPAELVGRVLAGSVRAREPLTDLRLVGPGLTALLRAGEVAAPVRPADLAVAALVRTGDRVDVLAAPPGSTRAETVVAGALVLAAGGPVQDATADPAAGLLLIAVDGPTAASLAAAAASSTLTVTLPPP
jgi:Flp pilus assembly protein CpaB